MSKACPILISSKRRTPSLVLALAISAALLAPVSAMGQAWSPAPPEKRCPSRWGAADERGAVNHQKPDTVLNAVRLIREGKIYELGKVLEVGMPTFPARTFSFSTVGAFREFGENQFRFFEDVVTTEIGHTGTQLDALPHIGIGDTLYNCVKISEVALRRGFTKLGVEKIGALFTRGVLLDVAGAKGKDMLEGGYEITVADLQDALRRSGKTLNAGDAVVIRTGWNKHWMKDNDTFMKHAPGIGIAAAEWLATMSPMLVGSDNFGIEVFPNPNPKLIWPVHQVLLVTHGIYLLENLELDALAKDGVSEFALVVQPLKVKGGTGSTVAPIAVK